METPHALVKDLRSTGYFYNELKSYSEAPEMDVSTYCSDFAVPYLVKTSATFDRTGQPYRSRILKFAVQQLSETGDIVDSIFGLKQVAASEIDVTGKAALLDQLDKLKSLANRQRLESAEFLNKLLVNVIKVFKLTEPATTRRRTDDAEDPAHQAVMSCWGALES